jgi:lipopolysaccharide transport system ATP-binding protein
MKSTLPVSSACPPNELTDATVPTSEGDAVIRLEDISVRFRIPRQPAMSLKQFVLGWLHDRPGSEERWALRQVSLVVRRGECVGLIGRNGAGKSTLLRLIARVLRPTCGRVWVMGQVAPLLEIGAGFHPELMGYENVYLNAALLGHSAKEVAARFADIVDFAELGNVIDTPLRTYSSGMIARLGFAVAIAWEPDILIVDEVLAVGDEAFQRKCLERIDRLRRNGVTILVVSHSTATVRDLCDRAVWLDRGEVRCSGPAATVTDLYSSQ